MGDSLPDSQVRPEDLVQEKVKVPSLYRVLLHNDDFTTMEFVVEVLEDIFHKPPSEAVRIMLSVHEHGTGTCGIFTKEIAEMKIQAVHQRAREAGFPLLASMEKT